MSDRKTTRTYNRLEWGSSLGQWVSETADREYISISDGRGGAVFVHVCEVMSLFSALACIADKVVTDRAGELAAAAGRAQSVQ